MFLVKNNLDNTVDNFSTNLISNATNANTNMELSVTCDHVESNIIDKPGLDLTTDYPTDRGHFKELDIVQSDLKRSILLHGPCKPINIEFPYSPDGKGILRRFSVQFYYKTTNTGLRIPRTWICYSVILDCTYCETCWLFADRKNSNFKINWISGINDWHHIGEKIGTHEISQQHIQATEVRVRWLKNETIDKHIEDKIVKEATFWRSVLIRLIKIILFLTAGNTALRGNENSKTKINTTEDSTQDITKIDQLSVILRYVVLNYGTKSIEVKESFFGFFELKKHGSEDYENLIYDVLKKYNLDVQNCRGQGYDGAAVMSGVYSGVQQRISSVVSNAHYVHCCAHNLNLVICDAAKSTQVASNFFTTLQSIFNFFSFSCPRWASLAFGDETAKTIRLKVLKKVCPTRWEARHSSVSALKERYIGVIKSLTYLSLSSSKADEKHMAISIKKKIESFEFLLMLCLWERVLRPLHGVSKLLQQKDIDLQKALDRLTDAYTCMQQLRNDYCSVVENAKNLAIKWGIPTDDKEARQKKARRFFDEVDGDRRINITQDNFKVKVFLPIVDTILSQLKFRFKGLRNVCNIFNFLKPESLLRPSEITVKESYDFIQMYQSDISSDLTSQLLSIKEIISNKNLNSIQALASFILENDFATSYSEVLGACIIYLTLPVTVATAERSFSKLKIIKNYLRNSIGQERLSNISVLNIEQSRTKDIDIEKIITNFSNMKARRMKFD
ncbi:zinc finger MYM-type protein 1-like [Melanaphis sacchari]|uniref:zinc finger MYM-type protein 1-like n=1 Tax=Melanaphis sacchari TaxID=742174 RepID=UPI000DC150DE|nr:zinc finger MYM-type protein 1-like [Melanaphis sacchari]